MTLTGTTPISKKEPGNNGISNVVGYLMPKLTLEYVMIGIMPPIAGRDERVDAFLKLICPKVNISRLDFEFDYYDVEFAHVSH